MKRKTFNVLFFIRKNKLMKNGEAPICLRITVEGRMSDIQIKRSVPIELWNQAKEHVIGKGKMADELNNYITSIRIRLFQIHRELEENGKAITADRIKNIYMGNDDTKKTLLQIFSEHNAQCRQLIGKDFVAKTVQRYETTAKYLGEFMQKRYNIADIYLSEVTPSFIQDFEVFLKVEKGCAQNAATTRLKNIKKMFRIAMENDWVKKNPFVSVKFKREATHPEFLTMDEIQTIAAKEITIKRVEQVRDVFLFCCFSGLSFSDVQQLSKEHLVKDREGKTWIRKTRQKTNNMCNIPLLPIALQLIEKYSTYSECVESGLLFPVPSNQKYNSYLKEVADICGITKHVSSHVARHSYATSVCLANGVSMENVAKMLGHSDTKMTMHYARVLDSSIMKDMEGVEKLLSAHSALTFKTTG
ncbi:site-specific integrase [Parabacteroides sp. PF5-9]|uniref:site-specific integrase n=1 Tax=Parabacteroides sp. PF5-9 TaxID=1742404 RepID=UPI002472F104|nr:site-specific integrase [Parabacteroides sp. PF5-9]MDH6356552.1 site-specific recombinase XerD [Parabacteroides sp. PF5-9]